ncbi:ComEC/Rec2 family competence protein [soil metagenome]
MSAELPNPGTGGVDLRLATPVAAAWAVLAILLGAPNWLAPAAIGCGVLAVLLLILLALRRSRRPRVTVAVAVVAVGLASTALLLAVAGSRLPARQPEVLRQAANAGRHVTAVLTTTSAGGDPYTATLDSVAFGDKAYEVRVPVTVFAGFGDAGRDGSGQKPDASDRIELGTSIRVTGTLAVAEPASSVAFLVFASGGAEPLAEPPWYLDWANSLRDGLSETAHGLPGDGGDLLPGLAIGDTSAVSDELDEAMKAASLTHLTAVSGANCAVVIGLVLLGGSALGARRGMRLGAAFVVLVGFVILVTPQPSVLRAAVMAALVLFALARGRPVQGIPVLALATLVLLMFDPWLARNYGFVLSVLATAGLLLFARPLAAVLGRVLPAKIAALIAIPLAAQLACGPVLILLNPGLPTYGVVANLLAEPAAPIATVLGLIACVLLPLVPAIGQPVALVAWLPAAWIAAVARFFAGLPGANIPWLSGVIGVVLLTLLTVVALYLAFGIRRGSAWRRIAAATLALSVVVYGGVIGGNNLRVQLAQPDDWQIAACDIGQGDAVLMRSQGKVALIDTGPEPKLLAACLSRLRIDRLDLLVLSHYDLDHVGGTSAILGRVDRVLVGPSDGADADRLVAQLVGAGANVERATKGMTGTLGALDWQVLWPRGPTGGATGGSGAAGIEPGNDASVTVLFGGRPDCACLSALFLGDLGRESQLRMLASNSLGHVDVVKVAHHGSADQYEPLYQTISATIGLVSVGIDNDYGHPTETLLGILSRNGTLTARTDLEGLVLVSPRDDGAVAVWTERAMPPAKLTKK